MRGIGRGRNSWKINRSVTGRGRKKLVNGKQEGIGRGMYATANFSTLVCIVFALSCIVMMLCAFLRNWNYLLICNFKHLELIQFTA